VTFIPIDSNNELGFKLAVKSVAMQGLLTFSSLLNLGQDHTDVTWSASFL